MWKRVAIAVGCVIVLLVLCVGCAPAAAPVETQAAAMQIEPVSGLAKTQPTLYGAGFVPGENIRVEMVMAKDGIPVAINMGMGGARLQWVEMVMAKDGIPVAINMGMGGKRLQWVANESGAIVGKVRIPHAYVAEPGVYTVKAIGDQGSVAVCPLGVLAPPE